MESALRTRRCDGPSEEQAGRCWNVEGGRRRASWQGRAVRAAAWLLVAMAVGGGGARGQGAEGIAGVGKWPRAPASDTVRLEDGAAFLMARLNILRIFPTATTLERVIAIYVMDPAAAGASSAALGYGGGGVPVQPRYFFVLEVAQGADPFVFVLEGYQDAQRNWLPVLQERPRPARPRPAPLSTAAVRSAQTALRAVHRPAAALTRRRGMRGAAAGQELQGGRRGAVLLPPGPPAPPSLPYYLDASRPSSRTNWICLVPSRPSRRPP